MAINSKDLFAKLPEARREKILARADQLIDEANLAELRQARRRSQIELAKLLGVKQAAVSTLGSLSDSYAYVLLAQLSPRLFAQAGFQLFRASAQSIGWIRALRIALILP
jgi:DNA-binding XRE family transcriptional regulator